MTRKLIDFYEKYPLPRNASDQEAAKEWIQVVSGLNKNRSKSLAIRYRRERQEQNIASPLSNLLRVFNALLGAETVDTSVLDHFVKVVNVARDLNLKIDHSGLKSDGFGIVKLTDGNVNYELQSYKPVHFGFVQTDTKTLTSDGLYEFNVFRQLMSYIHNASTISRQDTDPTYCEHLAVASLLVPYEMKRNRTSPFFHHSPLKCRYPFLFADMDTSAQRDSVIRWVQRLQGNCNASKEWIDRIRCYEEPSFLPKPTRQQSS
jgi:hypothetical protein